MIREGAWELMGRMAAGLVLFHAVAGGAMDFTFDFRNGASKFGEQGWEAWFTDLPPEHDRRGGLYELDWGIRRRGYLLQGRNRSDDLGMYLVKRLGPEDGLAGGRAYRVMIEVDFASNAPSGCQGAGEAPGEDVHLQLGVTPLAPARHVDEERELRLISREERFEAGDIANGDPCPEDSSDSPPNAPFRELHRVQVLDARASKTGELWIMVGTESGFEGLTRVFLRQIRVTLEPLKE